MAATTVPALTEPTASDEPRRPSSERFEVGRLIGRGGMGEVHLARDLRVDREVAIKSLRGTTRPEAVARFLREARVQARLDHPAIVPVYDVDVDDAGVPYFAMKCVTGVTLDVAIEQRWPRRQLLARLVDVCLAIELAHTRGIVHRDLKPSNIMLGDFGEVYVLDWGIASLAEMPDEPGAMLGTAGYMAPEQIAGGEVEARTDVFALGLLLYEILAGQPALPRGPDAYEPTLAARWHRPSAVAPMPGRQAIDVPPELDDICARATANAARDRFTARTLADAIVRYLDGDRDLERRRELVDEHVHAARVALAKGADANAMREVGCALALDPTDHRALTIVRKILVEPPREPPPAVIAKREAERLRSTQLQLGIAQKIYACFLVLLPLALLTKHEVVPAIFALGGALVFAIAGCRFVHRRPHLIDGWMAIVLVLHCVMVAILGTIVGPFQVVPIVGVISLAMFLNHPATKRFGVVIAVHVVMVVIPFILELLHITPRTFSFDGKRLVIDLLAADIGPAGVMTAIVGTVWGLSFVIAWLVIRQRRAQEHARDRLHLHSWRLAQLLPADAGRSLPPNRVSSMGA